MTTMTIAAARQNRVFTAIREWVRSAITSWRAAAGFRKTAVELNSLTDRELEDIGITRDQITAIAYGASFDRNI